MPDTKTTAEDERTVVDGTELVRLATSGANWKKSIQGILSAGLNVSFGTVGGTWNGAAVGVTYGGTGQTAYVKGDLLAASGPAALGRLAVGANNDVLVADSAAVLGVKWAPPTGGIVVNSTTITGGASGNFVYDNAGVFGERSAAQATAALDLFSTSVTTKGLVPGSAGVGATYFLNATGTWSIPSGGGGGGAPVDGEYITYASNVSLSAERRVMDNSVAGGTVFDMSVAGEIKSKLYASAADRYLYSTGASAYAEGTITAFGRSLVDDADATAARTTLGAQASDAELTAIAGLTSAADQAPYFTGAGTAGLMTVTTAARSILDDASVGAIRTTLGVGTADNPQFATIELGAATDTTLSRSAAGVIAVEGVTVSLNSITATHVAGTIELGNATDTTLSRSAAGILAVEGVAQVRVAGNQNLSGGFTATSFSDGTVSSGTLTPNPLNGNFHHYTNGGAHTLAPPTSPCTMVIEVLNSASAGAITTSGFTKVGGDTYNTTNANKFVFFVTKTNSYSHLQVTALQ